MAVISDSAGIVLKRMFSSRYKVALLDKQHGRIEPITYVSQMTVGSLITYTLSEQRGNYFLAESQLLYIPLSLAKVDILFLHHVLELIYYFAPVGSSVSGVFDLLAFLYMAEHMLMSVQFKKFFLLKLLTLLGATPEMESMHSSFISQMSAMAITQFDTMVIDVVAEKELDKWLWCCIWQHPYSKEFKTVHFLKKNRAV
jgi:hypothetical protein